MTIITGTEYKANQGKYIKRAQERERVIISSHGSYVELKPVPETDKDVLTRGLSPCAYKQPSGNDALIISNSSFLPSIFK